MAGAEKPRHRAVSQSCVCHPCLACSSGPFPKVPLCTPEAPTSTFHSLDFPPRDLKVCHSTVFSLEPRAGGRTPVFHTTCSSTGPAPSLVFMAEDCMAQDWLALRNQRPHCPLLLGLLALAVTCPLSGILEAPLS